MEIQKRIKCLHCGFTVIFNESTTGHCECKKVTIVEGHIQGTIGTDYIDVSPKLLNE